MELRAYQEQTVEQIIDYAVDHPRGRLLVVMAPRSGKTPTISMAAKIMALDTGSRCLWVVHRREILEAAVEHLIECGVPEEAVGIVYRDCAQMPDRPFQVASEATLDRRNKPDAQLVVWDEAHHDVAPRRRRIRALYPDAFHLGSTGTPHLTCGTGLDGDYDHMIVPVQPSELIHDGYLAVPTVFAPEDEYLPDLKDIRLSGGDYAPEQLERLVGQEATVTRLVEEWERLAEGRSTIVYAVTVPHSKLILREFQRKGIDVAHLDGTTPNRHDIVTRLRTKRLTVACSVGVLSEGIDLPVVKCVVMARPTASLSLHIQQGARCMTPFGKMKPRILDFVGNTYRHGFAYEDRAWSLLRKKNARGGDRGGGGGGGPRAKRCKCGALAPSDALRCAACGEKLMASFEVVDCGALVEVRLTLEQIAKKELELKSFASKRGFSSEWVAKVLAAIVGGA